MFSLAMLTRMSDWSSLSCVHYMRSASASGMTMELPREVNGTRTSPERWTLLRCFSSLITKSDVESRHVRNEISFALDQGTPFLAVHLEDTKLPVGLKLRMGGIQGILKWRLRPEHYARKLASCFHPPLSGNKRPRCCNTQLRKHFGRTLLCPTVPLMVSKS